MKQRRKKSGAKIVLVASAFILFVMLLYLNTPGELHHPHGQVESGEGETAAICLSFTAPLTAPLTARERKEEFERKGQHGVKAEAALLPHPAKLLLNGGEDALFLSPDHLSFGVADGVGGWSSSGVDAGVYSKALASAALDLILSEGIREPMELLCKAEERVRGIVGSSTACFITIEGDRLKVANIGDSGFLLLRDRSLLFSSPEMIHSFNFPYQIGSYGDGLDATERFDLPIKEGDVIIVGSDGLFDNLFDEQIVNLLFDEKMEDKKAEYIAGIAMQHAMDDSLFTPFAKKALESNFYHRGGKLDDISLIIATIT